MIKNHYDAVLTSFANTKFTAYYKKGINIKLSDEITVITIWKPGKCPHHYGNEEVYKDAIIELSGNFTNKFTYSDLKKLEFAIESGIDYLNMEKENLIDKEKIGTYEHQKMIHSKTNKSIALKYADLEIGGIYVDEKKKKWLFLGQGTLFENGIQQNQSNDGVNYNEYIYMDYSEKNRLEKKGINEFSGPFTSRPNSYAAKKRFFEKIDQLDCSKEQPIIIKAGSIEYQVCIGMKPKTYKEIRGRKL